MDWKGGDQFLVEQIQKQAMDIRWLLEHSCASSPIHHLRSEVFLTKYFKEISFWFSRSRKKQEYQMPLDALLWLVLRRCCWLENGPKPVQNMCTVMSRNSWFRKRRGVHKLGCHQENHALKLGILQIFPCYSYLSKTQAEYALASIHTELPPRSLALLVIEIRSIFFL